MIIIIMIIIIIIMIIIIMIIIIILIIIIIFVLILSWSIRKFESFYFFDFGLKSILSGPWERDCISPARKKGLFNFYFGHDGLILISLGPSCPLG